MLLFALYQIFIIFGQYATYYVTLEIHNQDQEIEREKETKKERESILSQSCLFLISYWFLIKKQLIHGSCKPKFASCRNENIDLAMVKLWKVKIFREAIRKHYNTTILYEWWQFCQLLPSFLSLYNEKLFLNFFKPLYND